MIEQELIQQLVGVWRDQADRRPSRGVVAKVSPAGIEVRLGTTGTVLRGVNVVGGAATVAVGDPVYLLYFPDGTVLAAGLRGGVGQGGAQAALGAHTHDLRYYTRGQVDARLRSKAEADHQHSAPTWLSALGGTLGGFEIDAAEIRALGTVWRASPSAHLAFGAPAPDAFGGPGVWLGFDAGDTLDAEGQVTPVMAPKLSLYGDEANFLEWTGAKVLVQAANFKLDGAGNIAAAGGVIGGWTIAPAQLTSPGGALVLDSAGSLRGNYTAGLRGWRLDEAGNFEGNHVVVRGELRGSVFVMDVISVVGGQALVRPGGTLYEQVTTV